ncbi:uncharacterized protein LOC116596990 [Mustela erminea]|uniref:uncharacterized protein LOC116596990 n=1 Tax=Mustela erminea TaxID=36723 RepID=UPI0013874DC6|nr:uncharacterized protein LOC116596990 [Mustela erminea]
MRGAPFAARPGSGFCMSVAAARRGGGGTRAGARTLEKPRCLSVQTLTIYTTQPHPFVKISSRSLRAKRNSYLGHSPRSPAELSAHPTVHPQARSRGPPRSERKSGSGHPPFAAILCFPQFLIFPARLLRVRPGAPVSTSSRNPTPLDTEDNHSRSEAREIQKACPISNSLSRAALGDVYHVKPTVRMGNGSVGQSSADPLRKYSSAISSKYPSFLKLRQTESLHGTVQLRCRPF